MVEFSDDKQFIGFWFVYPGESVPGCRRHDWFCASWVNPDGTLELHYRFHYYDEPNDPSEGERSWRGMKSKVPVDAAGIIQHIGHTHELAAMNSLKNFGSEMAFVPCEMCNGTEAVRLLKKYPWFHDATGKMHQEKT